MCDNYTIKTSPSRLSLAVARETRCMSPVRLDARVEAREIVRDACNPHLLKTHFPVEPRVIEPRVVERACGVGACQLMQDPVIDTVLEDAAVTEFSPEVTAVVNQIDNLLRPLVAGALRKEKMQRACEVKAAEFEKFKEEMAETFRARDADKLKFYELLKVRDEKFQLLASEVIKQKDLNKAEFEAKDEQIKFLYATIEKMRDWVEANMRPIDISGKVDLCDFNRLVNTVEALRVERVERVERVIEQPACYRNY